VNASCVIFTIGHSVRPAAEFVELLQAHDVDGIADVRRFPASRRHPHFSREALAQLLASSGRRYAHFPELGGRRQPSKESRNTAWQNASFRAYADYMETDTFRAGLHALLAFAAAGRAAVMCAEAPWWRCHRQLIADALVARGIEVRHIMSSGTAPVHRLTPFARVDGEHVIYPGLLGDSPGPSPDGSPE
jgi:uncharacterized protein (DUF488 family)